MSYPDTILLDGHQLNETRAKLLEGKSAPLQASLQVLEARAQKWLSKGPWSVTTKENVPPSGDVHDYTSQAPYWWPSDTPDGSPYVQRDGQKNPEVYQYSDRVGGERVLKSAFDLTLAWFYTRKEAYSIHAAHILRTWFLSPSTRMNPNLNHAQMIPFANDGRCIGIIDFSQSYSRLLDAAVILAGDAPGWTKADDQGFREWNVAFLEWLTNSKFGIQESNQTNNHGVFAAMQKAAIARFLGEHDQVQAELQRIQGHIDTCVAADGSQPEELKRTRSWHYSVFNLLAFTRAAAVGAKAGVDIWSYRGPEGQSIMKAIEFIIPAATLESPWNYPDLKFGASAAADVIRAAAAAGKLQAQKAVPRLTLPADDMWPLRQCPEQLDTVR